jgi:(1->4)-alpha-D-glucan 1-alpha-D-glucosylmutase
VVSSVPIPTATYRLQITRDFDLDDAAAVVGYLTDLGVGAIYLSPLLQATAGSDHGYDVVDHRLVDPSRGGARAFDQLAEAARQAGIGIVVDIVPNHMGVSAPEQNHAWWELLRTGREGRYGDWFDVDWVHPDGRILIPVLGDDFEPESDLSIVDGELCYYEHRYPIADGSMKVGDSPAQVHDRQFYELVSYRRADTDQNYRRFFAVTSLAGLRVEDPVVFEETHREILRWLDDYGVSGIRIDHPDGLRDPQAYLARLRQLAPSAWITVEKITEPGERLEPGWPVDGMTGYDALAEVNGVMVDPGSAVALTAAYQRVTGDQRDYEQHVEAGKRQIATSILRAEIRRMGRLVPAIDNAVPALTELVIAFPVYRSYLPRGRAHLDEAVGRASQRAPQLAGAIEQLLPVLLDPAEELCWRFQQATGAVTAKGVEDTAYYRYSRLISLNEVGGYPGTVGMSVPEFHAAMTIRQADAPHAMTTLSTHDTKRGEDIRARISVLAECPEEWATAASRLMSLAPIPSRAFSYLLWQTVVATGLVERPRLHAYAEKAMREASEGTRWIDPVAEFEDAVHAAVDAAYDRADVRAIVENWHDDIGPAGLVNSFSQKLLQLCMPGVPDVYQGSELFEDSLVDPDNRRRVDFARRASLLRELENSGFPGPPLGESAKLWLVSRVLRLRRDEPHSFGSYLPLPIAGDLARHGLAFDRGGIVAVSTRLPLSLQRSGGWGNTELVLPDGEYLDVLSGARWSGRVLIAELLARYPGAVLTRERRTETLAPVGSESTRAAGPG